MKVLIDNRQDKVSIDDDIYEVVEKVARECLKLEGKGLNFEVSVSFVDNEEIQKLNRDYRNVDSPTDVLSFPMDAEETDLYIPLLGDIVISAERALEQATEFGHSFLREVAYLAAHSMFHLMGYDHMNVEEKKIMRQKEKEVMKILGIFKNMQDE
jgi:probable rRNA maturation factor